MHIEDAYQTYTAALNICCPRDCVSRHNGGTSGAPLKPLRVDSALNSYAKCRMHRSIIEALWSSLVLPSTRKILPLPHPYQGKSS